MRLLTRLLVFPLLILLLTALLYTTFKTTNPVHDIWTQYDIPKFIVHTFRPKPDALTKFPPSGIAGDKVIVMAKTMKDDTSWVEGDLWDWQNAIYTVDAGAKELAMTETLATPANKGHEAMAYLTYVIDNYDALPGIITFIHPHRDGFLSGWHTDTALHSNVDALRYLNLSHVEAQGYVNLRCNWNPGCREADENNEHVTAEIWADVFAKTSTMVPFPGRVGQACCAQFAVSKAAVRKRPQTDYQRMREWLLTTELSDRKSGRVMEFLWQVIFGMDAIFCPDEEKCYCDVYGRCADR